jgi:hypothetical protein
MRILGVEGCSRSGYDDDVFHGLEDRLHHLPFPISLHDHHR